MREPSWFSSCSFTFAVTFLAGPPRIPIMKVTYFCSYFGKIPKIPVLELVGLANTALIRKNNASAKTAF